MALRISPAGSPLRDTQHIQRHANDTLRVSARFILEVVNYIISKITWALFTNTAHLDITSQFFHTVTLS